MSLASDAALYIASRYVIEGNVSWRDGSGNVEFSTLHRFALEGATAKYVASGGIVGRVLNQFAVDEHEGHFRVASSIGHGRGGESLLTVLDSTLAFEGVVSGLGPNEDIRAVRYDGDLAFVVTFEKTDPFYYIDLSEPTQPRVAGELKIPGFSTYMHMLDDSHLLSIGYDADDQGNFSWFRGVMLQIFDVSEARTLLALPMTICDGKTGGNFGDVTFSGLLVYDVSVSDGFARRGGLAFNEDARRSACANWWTQADSVVNRSIFMEDFVLGFSGTELKASNVASVDAPVASLSLDVAPDSQCRSQ